MIKPATLSGSATDRVLRTERLRNTRRASTLRVAIVGLFLANMLVMTFVLDRWQFSAGLVIFAIYFLLAAALWIVVHRSERAALLSWISLPTMDMPMVFAIQVAVLPQRTATEEVSSVLSESSSGRSRSTASWQRSGSNPMYGLLAPKSLVMM